MEEWFIAYDTNLNKIHISGVGKWRSKTIQKQNFDVQHILQIIQNTGNILVAETDNDKLQSGQIWPCEQRYLIATFFTKLIIIFHKHNNLSKSWGENSISC